MYCWCVLNGDWSCGNALFSVRRTTGGGSVQGKLQLVQQMADAGNTLQLMLDTLSTIIIIIFIIIIIIIKTTIGAGDGDAGNTLHLILDTQTLID